MKVVRIVSLIVTLAGVTALGLAWVPVIYRAFDSQPVRAQGRSFESHGLQAVAQGGPHRRALAVLAGRGEQLGVRISDLPDGGVRIDEVEPDSAASKAGLKAGDVVTSFDGERVRSARQFARLVQETAPGRTVTVSITRSDRKQDIQITMTDGRDAAVIWNDDHFFDRFAERLPDLDLGNLPYDFHFDYEFPPMGSTSRLGVTVNSLTGQLAEYFGAKEGALVTSVVDGSAASRAGLKAGDVITSVNGSHVASREDLLRVLRDSSDDDVTLGIVRDRKEMTVHVKVEARRSARSARPV
jgi:S1-C subfamily serine protease